MNRTALIYEGLSLDWFGVIVAAACFVGVCVTCLLRKLQKGSINEILTIFCIGTPLALILARVQYCLSKVDLDALGVGYIFTGMHEGGYGLYGAMGGILLAVLLTAVLWSSSTGELADCVATAGAGIIAVGRFATRFTMDALGFAMPSNAFTVHNEVDGLDYLAVFYLDGIVESVIFVVCIGLFLFNYGRKESRYTKGNIALIFLMLHGLNQVVMDSLNTMTLCLFNNEFIKASQIIGIVSWLVIIIVFICRLIKKQLFKKEYLGIIAAFVGLVIVAVFMEYRVGNSNYVSAHIVMGACMVIMAILSLIIVAISESKPKSSPVEEADSDVEVAEVAPPQYSFATSPVANVAQEDDFALDDDFDYAYETIGGQQSDDSGFEDDFDYMYETIAPGTDLRWANDEAINAEAPMEEIMSSQVQAPTMPQEQHRISSDTLDDLRRQFAEMDNL